MTTLDDQVTSDSFEIERLLARFVVELGQELIKRGRESEYLRFVRLSDKLSEALQEEHLVRKDLVGVHYAMSRSLYDGNYVAHDSETFKIFNELSLRLNYLIESLRAK